MQFFLPSLLLGVAAAIAPAHSPAHKNPVWQMQDSGTTASLRGIDSVDSAVAWASGTGGTVLLTLDGGAHWQTCKAPAGISDWKTLDFRGIEAWDSATAMVMASGPGKMSRLYETEDACATWTLMYSNPDSPKGFFDSFWLNSMYGEGMLLGDPVKNSFAVFLTQDGGKTWKRDEAPGLSVSGKSLAAFAASNSSIARSTTGFLRGFVTGGKDGAVLYQHWGGSLLSRKYRFHLKPPNLVETEWSTTELPLSSGADATGGFSLGFRPVHIRCKDCGIGAYWHFVAVGGDYTKPNDSTGTAAYSLDGGAHWHASTTPPHGHRSAVQWSDTLKAWITAGTNGSDISRDDGRTWQPLDNGNWNALSLPFIVGPNGRIAKLNPSALPKH